MLAGSLARRSGHAAAQQRLALSPRPTAVIVDNNLGGVGLIRALLDAGVAIGRDISVFVNKGVPEDTLFSQFRVAAATQLTACTTGQTLGETLLGVSGRQPPAASRQPLAERQVLRQPGFVDGDTIGPLPAD